MKALESLQIFVLTVKLGSLSAAGRFVSLSPATISRRIQTLEEELGVQLLDRDTRNARPTEAGMLFYQRISGVLDDVSQAADLARQIKETPSGRLRIHSRSLVGTRLIAPKVYDFARQFPEIKIELDLSEGPADLLENDYDIDIRVGRIMDSSYVVRRLADLENIVVASPRYLATVGSIEKPSDLLLCNCLGYRSELLRASWHYKEHGEIKILPVEPKFFSNNGEVLRQAAIDHYGVSLISDLTVAEELRTGKLVRVLPNIEFSLGTFDNGVFCVFRPTKPLPTKIRAFVDYMARAFQNDAGIAKRRILRE